MIMMFYWVLIILLFLLLLLGAGWLMHRKEQDHQEEAAALRREIFLLQDKIRILTTPQEKRTKEIAESDAFLAIVHSIIDEGLADGDFSVEAVSAKMHMSAQTFRRRLLNATGTSPKDYILGIQMEKAAGLLLHETAMPVQEVGHRCGFDDASSFAHSFRRFYGCSPSSYRDGA